MLFCVTLWNIECTEVSYCNFCSEVQGRRSQRIIGALGGQEDWRSGGQSPQKLKLFVKLHNICIKIQQTTVVAVIYFELTF